LGGKKEGNTGLNPVACYVSFETRAFEREPNAVLVQGSERGRKRGREPRSWRTIITGDYLKKEEGTQFPHGSSHSPFCTITACKSKEGKEGKRSHMILVSHRYRTNGGGKGKREGRPSMFVLRFDGKHQKGGERRVEPER